MSVALPRVLGPLSEDCEDDAYASLAGYEAREGYSGARRTLQEDTGAACADEIRRSGWRARMPGGLARGARGRGLDDRWPLGENETHPPGDRYVVCSAGEPEPGCFKDRLLLLRAPHLLIEGLLVAAHALGARRSFVYMRASDREAAAALAAAIKEARAAGVLGESCLGTGFAHDVVLIEGAGSYIAGEETALLEAIEGRAARPRRKSVADAGLFGGATLVADVESYCHLPVIARHGSEWFRARGTDESPGTMLFSVSGDVERPGLYELPLGTALDAVVFEHAGGVPNGRKVRAVFPGGTTSPPLPAGQLDVGLSDEALRDRGTRLGSGAIIVLDESVCMVRVACTLAAFSRAESCGRCTLCREGSSWVHKLVARIERGAAAPDDVAVLADLAAKMEGQGLCGFADAAALPVLGLLRHFRADFDEHARLAKCPHAGSFVL